MDHAKGGEALERLLQVLTEAEAALTGPGPQAPRQAVQILAGAEELLRSELPDGAAPDPVRVGEARRRLARIARMVEFGAAYWSGLVSCSVAAAAYGPQTPGAYGVPPTGDLHG